MFNLEAMLNYVLDTDTITLGNIVVVLFILWMAHKFFLSIVFAFVKIFNTVVYTRTVTKQALSFLGILILVILTSILLTTAFAIKQTFAIRIIALPKVWWLSSTVFDLVLYIVIYASSVAIFRVYSRTRPAWFLCNMCSLLCMAGFCIFRLFAKIFLNIARYNFVYGFLSNLIIMVFEVYGFFIIFLFFAQFIYVCQNFSSHLIEELYLLQDAPRTSYKYRLCKSLFTASTLCDIGYEILHKEAFQAIYNKNDIALNVFYILEGNVSLSSDNLGQIKLKAGAFFGETQCVRNEPYRQNSIATSSVKLLKIPRSTFVFLVKNNSKLALKVLSH